MNTFDLKESPRTPVGTELASSELRDNKTHSLGCSQKLHQIEDEVENDDDSFGILTDVVENLWIDDPEHYDLFDIMTRNPRGGRRDDSYENEFGE